MTGRQGQGASRRNAVIAVTDQAVVAGAGFGTVMLLGRGLESSQFSAYVVALGLLNFLLAVHGALVNTPLSLRAGGEEETPGLVRYVRGAARLQLAQAAVPALVAIGIAALLDEGSPWRLSLMVFAILQLPYQLNDFTRRLMLARHAFRDLLWNDAVVAALRLGGVAVLMKAGVVGIIPAAVVLAFGFTSGWLMHAWRAGRRFWTLSDASGTEPMARVASANWSVSRSMLPEVAGYQMSIQGFVLFAASWLTAVELAAFGGLQSVANMVNVFLMGLTNHGFADMVRSRHRRDYPAWLRGLRALSASAMIATLLCAFSFVTIPELLIRLFYGDSTYMIEFAYVLRAFGAVAIARTVSVILITTLRSVELHRAIAIASLVGGIVSLVLAPLLMSSHGLVGAVGGTIAVHGLLCLVLLAAAMKMRHRVRNLILAAPAPLTSA